MKAVASFGWAASHRSRHGLTRALRGGTGECGSALVGEGLREAVFRSEVQWGVGTEGGGHGLNYIFKGTCDVKKPSMRPGCQQALGGLLLPQVVVPSTRACGGCRGDELIHEMFQRKKQ